jgi:pre-mRNA-splicing factor SYF1
MDSVVTVKDFSQIWDAYAKFEDGLIAAQVETMDKQEDPDELIDFDLRIARYENLLARQPLLVNSVLLRQNPHNVHEWQKRAKLYQGNNRMIVETYSQALSTVDPMKALGKPYFLWIEFAQFYESLGDLDKARKVFEQGTVAPWKTIDELASLWCAYAELDIRQKNYVAARNLLHTATTIPRSVKSTLASDKDTVHKRVYRSTKLWSLYVDVEESVGTFANTKAVYERILELKVASPQLIINFAHFLEEHKFYEESFKAYEKGISLFKFPHSLDIWVAYLIKFVARYGGKKLERARDLFEQVLSEAPARDSKIFFIMYANLEEEFGLARHAMSVYDRATRTVAEEDRFAIFSLYVNRASEFFGVTRTRDIYEQAISILPDQHAKTMSLRYAELEKKLGEIDRARAIFIHASQFTDPRVDAQYWLKWREFEVEHGNQDTFREMLRIKRSVQAQLNTSVNVMASQMLSEKEKDITKAARPALPPSDMEILERAANLANKEIQAAEQAAKMHNPEVQLCEINL